MKNNSDKQTIAALQALLATKNKEYKNALRQGKVLKELKQLRAGIRELEAEIKKHEGPSNWSKRAAQSGEPATLTGVYSSARLRLPTLVFFKPGSSRNNRSRNMWII